MQQIKSKTIHCEITYQCNNRCFYCYNEEHKPLSMSLDQAKILVERIEQYAYSANRSLRMILTGGEPFENFEVLKYLYKQLNELPNVNATINTNLAVDIEKINEILELIDKKTTLFVSVPSMIKDIYNKITNSSNFEKFEKALRYCLNNKKISLVTNTVINDINFDTSLTTIMLLKLLNLSSYKLTVLLKHNKHFELIKKLAEVEDISRKVKIKYLGSSAPIIVNNDVIRTIEYQRLKQYMYYHCDAGYDFFAITPDGYLKPCPCLPNSTKYFNVLTSNEFIPEIIRNHRYNLACTKECTNP